MTISDEAQQAAILIARDFGDIELLRSNQQMDRLGESVQQTIKLHERDLVEALKDIASELGQSNGGKGPSLPLNIHILEIARAVLKKRGIE